MLAGPVLHHGHVAAHVYLNGMSLFSWVHSRCGKVCGLLFPDAEEDCSWSKCGHSSDRFDNAASEYLVPTVKDG